MTRVIRVPANLYQQFDADYSLDVPAEGYGGWKTVEVKLPLDRTAVVSMHPWQLLPRKEVPGHYRAVEYIQRSYRILEGYYPRLLAAARRNDMQVLHVVGGEGYYEEYPGWKKTLRLAGEEPEKPEGAYKDASLRELGRLRSREGFPGEHNQPDIQRDVKSFPKGAQPVGEEPIAQTAHQLNQVCRAGKINHLIYIGFAINWCLLMSPAGMLDMGRYGYLCSTVRECTTAVENRESARREAAKQLALWRVSLAFGFVFEAGPLISALAVKKTDGKC